jgi:hypothetical protein
MYLPKPIISIEGTTKARSVRLISRLKTLLADLLWEKNIVPAEKKQAEKDGL